MKSNTTPKPRSYRQLWISLTAVIVLPFVVLGYYGTEIYRKAPPIPKRVGDTIFAFGALGIGWFVLGLKTDWSFTGKNEEQVVL